MMKRKMKPVNSIIVTAIITVMVIFSDQSILMGEKNNLQLHLHKIILSNSSEGISPNPVRIKKGDTIVWFNRDKEPVVIKFIPEIGIVCSPIINFYADLSGFYKSGSIHQGGTASLCFIRSGEYEYEVIRLVAKPRGKPVEQILQGKVIVK